ncbi:hypothetical protein [Aquimarina mytili]|uniref:DUF4129 domain-containing protein n=1 Tax=Aquimarina mytili TaxID=874423 RepID=A0A937DBZ3_9FLAO|nr:hypothetical protein [Aquimarina mytili]MBL0684371.1 hypothetical protein [Aquimarina mytili]
MSKKIYHIILLFLVAQLFSPIWAQQDTLQIAIDSSKISVIDFSDDLSEKYTGDDFDYNTVEGEAENFLGRALNWFFNGLQSIFGITINPQLAKLLENIIYILFIGIAIYIVTRVLVGKDAVSFFRKKNKLVAPINITEEHIEKIDLDALIAGALKEKNYRLAIRYMYLKALQDLSLKKIIDYHFEKTNTDYYREIADITIKQNFNRVSYLYDYIWYGKFELDKNGYLNAKESFDKLNDKMKSFG